MKFGYVLINFALYAALLYFVGKKLVAKMFASRRDALNETLDETERFENEPDLVLPEEEPLPADDTREKTAALEAAADAAVNAIRESTEEEKRTLRRAVLTDERLAFIDRLSDATKKKLLEPETNRAFNERAEALLLERLPDIRLSLGDAERILRERVLRVRLLRSGAVSDGIVAAVRRTAETLLTGCPEGTVLDFETQEEETLSGGIRLVVGDTCYSMTGCDAADDIADVVLAKPLNGRETAEDLRKDAEEAIEALAPRIHEFQTGRVLTVSDGICWMNGLSDIMYGEVVEFESGEHGMVLDIKENEVGCIIYGRYENIEAGTSVRRIGQIATVPVGEELLGRVVNPLGEPVDGGKRIFGDHRRPIESPAPAIPDRMPVKRPLHTGIKAIDSMIPIGRGQRELVIGDRQTGKSSILIDTILAQKGQNVVCIYVAIGQKDTTVAEIRERLAAQGCMDYTTIVSAPASSSASFQYIAPFAGCAMAEYYLYSGRDALVIYDDLSKHAVAYRELSLLLHRPSGREAYPGDVFYLHSRLLERAAQLSEEAGGGSLTAIPVIETQDGDISAYIPTNVISITDGQIFLEADLFNAGQRPAVNVGLSVSRVGGAAQTKAMKKASGNLRVRLAQYRELVSFAQFGAELDPESQKALDSGAKIMNALRQDVGMPLSEEQEIAELLAAQEA